jgi:hypothetical protein
MEGFPLTQRCPAWLRICSADLQAGILESNRCLSAARTGATQAKIDIFTQPLKTLPDVAQIYLKNLLI